MFNKKNFFKSSKNLSTIYHDIGQFYIAKAQTWWNNNTIYTTKSKITYIPTWRAQDIDTKEDWKKAEILYWGNKKNDTR